MFVIAAGVAVKAGMVPETANDEWMLLMLAMVIFFDAGIFFSFEENRNPKRVKRLWLLVKKGHLPW